MNEGSCSCSWSWSCTYNHSRRHSHSVFEYILGTSCRPYGNFLGTLLDTLWKSVGVHWKTSWRFFGNLCEAFLIFCFGSRNFAQGEEDYNQLVIGLKENPNDQLIMSAMILNFQSRIDILQDVMQEIEKAKKSSKNEPTII